MKRRVQDAEGDYIIGNRGFFPPPCKEARQAKLAGKTWSGYYFPHFSRRKKAMRASLPLTLLLACLLSACAATSKPSPTGTNAQSGSLRVQPGLLSPPAPTAGQAMPQSAPTAETKQ